MTSENEETIEWRDVERIIRDLKADGYDPVAFESDTSAPRPIKTFELRVER